MEERLKNKRVIVTGGAGFVGSHLVRQLVKMGAEIDVIEKKDSSLWRISDCLKEIKINYTDISVADQVHEAIQLINPDYVFHLAAYGVNYQDQDFHQAIAVNIHGTLNLLEAIAKSDCQRFIHTGTCFEFDGKLKRPYKEDDLINPVSIYGITKGCTTQLLSLLAKQWEKKVVVIRPFGLYGPYEPEHRIIPYIIKKCLEGSDLDFTKGEQVRDYLYIDDLINAYITALFFEMENITEVFNIGSGNFLSLKDIILKTIDLLKYDRKKIHLGVLPYRENEMMYLVADINKSKRIMKWSPKILFAEGLQRTISWFQQRFKDEGSR